MRLLRVELDRYRSRRAVAMLVLLAAAVTAVLAATALWDTRPVTGEELARAEAQAAAAAADPQLQEDIADCREHPEELFGPGSTAAQCDNYLVVRADDLLPRAALDLGLASQGRGTALIVVVTALLVIAGATFAGADWSTGSLSNQLLFVPGRGAVWAAKALAVALGGVAVAAVLVTGFWLALSLAADARGIDTPADVLTDIRWSALRGVLLAAAGGLGGFALTMVVRSTVGTVAVLFAYVVGGEALLYALPVGQAGTWSLSNNVLAWLRDGTRVFDPDLPCGPSLHACQQFYVVGLTDGARYLGGVLAVALLVSFVTFRRRDIP